MPRAPRIPAPGTDPGLLGRERELAVLCAESAERRLVTLTGSAGIGKSRLAAAAAASGAAGLGPDGLLLTADLSGLLAPELLCCTLSRALDLPDRPDLSELAALAHGLAGQPTLLLLDGCERAEGQGAPAIEYLLGACPELTVLAVGRRALGLDGEYVLALAPLAEDPALELLTERAHRHGVPLEPDRAARRNALALCHLLDHNPLAIELAALRLREVPPHRLTAEVARPSGLLALSGTALDGPGRPYRHRSLHAAAQWSHELCGAPEMLLWARLSALPSGFDLAEAHGCCADPALPGPVLDAAWHGLLRGSVLVPDHAGFGRCRIPAVLRAYGREWLRVQQA
ncbi:hypothetical protein [Streptacidiphilus sp. P02-A3a]|uniref:ATP-binding protein n=1 Tax=Streptacidiphilus sp. P02-A3a TaxID=2704468 RepID=UPI0015F8286F|nr:hypothetical protein [Streptacidiphilus sp. P02-A3a]QMU71968.1 hypothetical protein GXP74_30750 [Streptacidiphilus sp. P02-A3a]